MVGEVIAAAVLNAEIDERAKRVGGRRNAFRRVLDVQVENDARIRLARPRQKRLVVLLDQAHRPVDDVRLAIAEDRAPILHECGQPRPFNVDLRDHFGCLVRRASRFVECDVIVVHVRCGELGVRPVDLP